MQQHIWIRATQKRLGATLCFFHLVVFTNKRDTSYWVELMAPLRCIRTYQWCARVRALAREYVRLHLGESQEGKLKHVCARVLNWDEWIAILGLLLYAALALWVIEGASNTEEVRLSMHARSFGVT